MFLRSILLGGTAALGASAVLVVPEMESQVEEVEDGFLNVPPTMLEEVSHSVVNLPCTACPFREINEEGVVTWTEGKPSTLMLEFFVAHSALLVNDRQVFPPVPPSPIGAIQQLEDGQKSGPVPVGYALEVSPVTPPSEEPGPQLLDVRLTVLDLEGHPVPVDTVAIKLIQDPAGDLYIANTDIEKTAPPPERLSWKKCEGKSKCLQQLLIARIRGLLVAAKDRVLGMTGKHGRKPCHGKHMGHNEHKAFSALVDGSISGPFDHHHQLGGERLPPPPFSEFDDGPDGFELGPVEHHRHHPHHDGDFDSEGDARPHHPPHHMHGPPPGALAHTFSRVVRFILIPALLGVLAGVAASAIGMLVGQAVVFLWQRYRGTKPQERKAAWEQGDACEKQGLMIEASDVALPVYDNEEEAAARGSMDKN